MSGGLRDLLGLPKVDSVAKTSQAADFGKKFRLKMAGLNRNMQVTAAQASPADQEPLNSQRMQLFEAFHKASAQIDPNDVAKAEPAIQRVIAAVSMVDGKASAFVSTVSVGREEWLKREADFDDAMLQITELEEAGHPKASSFRKLGEAVRDRANGRNYVEAANVLDQLRPKLEMVLAEVGPSDGAQPEGDPALSEDILKLIAERMGVDVDELGDLADLPKNVLDMIQQIAKLSPGGIIASELSEQVEALLDKLIDVIRDIIAKRRVKLACLVSVHNNTEETLTLSEAKFPGKRGNWSPGMVPKNTIGPGETDTFQAESPRHAKVYGVIGRMNYVINNKKELEWSVDFANPRDRKIKGSSTLDGKREEEFKTPQPQPTNGETATFAFQLNLMSDPNPPEPVHPEVPTEPEDPKDPSGGGGGTTPPVADLQASCLITVVNNSTSALTLIDQGHDVGDFMTSPPPTLAAGASTQFVSIETPNSDDHGCQGFLEWEIEGGGTWKIRWNNPEQEKNTTESTLSDGAEKNFRELDQIGQGDENVPVTFTLSNIGSPGTEPPVTPTEECARQGLTVLVKDKETGAAIANVAVTVGDQSDTTSSLGLSTVELPVGKHSYQATIAEYQDATGNVEITEGDNPELVIEMEKAKCEGPRQGLTILVRDKESGKAIPDAAVAVGDQSDTTSQNGLATVELPIGKHKYEASAQDYQSTNGEVEIIEGDNAELVIELAQGGECKEATLVVSVIDDADSKPIPGATVKVGEKTEQTSAAGLSVISLNVGKHTYEVSAENYSTENGEVEVEVAEGNDNELVVRLKKEIQESTVVFTVTDKETREPIPGASVKLGELTNETDDTGSCEFGVEAGKLSWSVDKQPEYSNATGSLEAPVGGEHIEYVELEKQADWNPPPESKQPTLRKGDKSADGWVEYLHKLLDKHGHPVPENEQKEGLFGEATYKAVKEFQKKKREGEKPLLVDGIVGNETWSFLRRAPREAVGVHDKPDEKGKESRWATEKDDFVTYDPEPKDELRMIAFSVGDAPIDGAPIMVRIEGKTSKTSKVSKLSLGKADGPAPTGSGQQHTLVISGIGASFPDDDTVIVQAYFEEELGGDKWEGDIPIRGGGGGGKGGGGGGKGGTPQTGTATLEVHVQDPEGNTSAGIKVRVTGGPTTPPDGSTDSSGIVRFQLVPGEYFVNAAFKAAVWEPGHIKSGSLKPGETFVLTLKKLATGFLSVLVFDNGEPQVGATVTVANAVHAPQKTDSSGTAFFTLPPGTYQVSAVPKDAGAFSPQSVTVIQGENSQLEFNRSGGI